MAPCSHPGQTQGREWWVSPRRLLSIGQPRTANPAGEHDTSAKKASLPGHCTCKRLRGPHEDRKKHRPPVTLDCSSTVPPACGDTRDCGRARVSTKQSIEPYTTPPHSTGGAGTLTTPSPNLVRVEPGAENPPRWYDAPTTPTTARAQPSCTWGKKGLGSTPSIFWPIRRHFLGAPECRQSPPTGGGATAVALHGTTHPRPCTKGGCGHRLCATWAAPRDGSNRRRASARCLAPHAPPFGRLRHKVGSCPPPQSEVHPE